MPVVQKQSPTMKPNGPQTGSVIDRIRPLSTEEDGLKVLLYGRSGTGKTTFWSTFPGPILAVVCSGGMNPGELKSIDSPEMRKKVSQVVVNEPGEMRQLIDYARGGKFRTVVLDHASGFSDLVLKEILGISEIPVAKYWGLATQQQYGQLTIQLKEIFRSLLSLSGNVVVVGQERTFGGKEDGVASDVIKPTVGAALTPQVTGWLAPACDYVVQTFIRPKMVEVRTTLAGKEHTTETRGKGVEYCLRTEAHDVFQTKFRISTERRKALPNGQLPECIVDPTYQKMVELIKGK